MKTPARHASDPRLNAEAFANRIALEGGWEETARKHTCLLGWNADRSIPEPLVDNGTCFLLQTRVGRFAVTCEHVWSGFESFRETKQEPRLWMSLIKNHKGSSPVGALVLSNPRKIAVDKSLDLAVFVFDEINSLESWRFLPFRFEEVSMAIKGDIVFFLGFPGEGIRAGAGARVLNYCFAARTIHDAGDRKFVLHSPPDAVHHKNQHGENSGPFRICGASGAPVFKLGRNFQLSLTGIVSGLLGFSGSTQPYEMSDGGIFITHAHFIQEDGSIVAP